MNKKVVVLLFVGLVILILLTIFLPLLIRTKTSGSTTNLAPTITTQPAGLAAGSIDFDTKKTIDQRLPYETADFKIEYSSSQNKVIATKKTAGAEQKIDQWLSTNNLSQLQNRPDIFTVQNNPEINQTLSPTINLTDNPSISPTINPTINLSITPATNNNAELLVDLLSILLNLGSTNTTGNPNASISSPLVTLTPSSSLSPTKKPTKTKTPTGNLVYYAQCGGNFDSYPLPSGCTVCQAGCGPTTVAMIAASYADKTITPKTVVDLYQKKGYLLGCAGSRYSDAKAALASYGVKTTDYLSYSSATINQVADDFRQYIKSGWTIFALANYCDGGCGHFFWIVDVTAGNDTWAYDPYYGRLQKPPYNEKSRYPFPKYRVAFGVKK